MHKKIAFGGIFVVAVCAAFSPAIKNKFFIRAAAVPSLKYVSPLVKVFKDKPVTGADSVSIKAAKNEYESFQIAITAGENAVSVTGASMGDLAGPNGAKIYSTNATLFNVDYVPIANLSGSTQGDKMESQVLGPNIRPAPDYSYWTTGDYPDPLIPFIDPVNGQAVSQSRGTQRWALPISVPAGQNRAIFADIFVPENAVSGIYSGSFTVNFSSSALGNFSLSIPITLSVWNFALPKTNSLKAQWVSSFNNISLFYPEAPNYKDPDFQIIEQRHANLMNQNRMEPPLPLAAIPKPNSDGSLYDADRPQQMKTWLDMYKPTVVRIWPFITNQNDQAFTNYFNNVKNWYISNGMNEWVPMLYYWLKDEPNDSDQYNYIAHYGPLVPSDIPTLVTEQTYPQKSDWANIDSGTDIWVPLWGFIDPQTMEAKLAQGDQLWTYQCCAQYTPDYHPLFSSIRSKRSPWWAIDRPTYHYRFPAWINYRYKSAGQLYWTIMSQYIVDPWNNPWDGPNCSNGEGLLVYPGNKAGFNAPVASIRLKAIRDSMEDYEYMKLLETQRGRAAVLAYTNQVIPEWWQFTADYKIMESARNQLGEILNGEPILTPTPSPSPTPTPSADPIVWLKFDDSVSDGIAADSSGMGNNGSCSGISCPIQSLGKDGIADTAYLFDGANNFLNLGSNSSLDLTGDFTVSLWFNAESWELSNWSGLISKRDTYQGMDWEFYYDNANKEIRFVYGNSASNILFAGSKINPSLGIWHLLNITRNGNVFTLYLDGQMKATAYSSTVMPAGDSLRIGVLGADEPSQKFKGRMDDVRLYKRALNGNEITNLYTFEYKSADFNSDTRVNSIDFGILMSWWGALTKPKSDINQDGYVNSVDFGIMLSQWTG